MFCFAQSQMTRIFMDAKALCASYHVCFMYDNYKIDYVIYLFSFLQFYNTSTIQTTCIFLKYKSEILSEGC